MKQRSEPSALRNLFRRGAIIARMPRRREMIAAGEHLFPLGHTHHGRYRLGHAVRAARGRRASVAAIVALVTMLASAHAAAPADTSDPDTSAWFQSLRQPDTGVSCCSLADCRETEYRTDGNGYEALIDGAWLPVPSEKILQRIANPTGRAVVCASGGSILCFVRPSET